MNKDIKNISDSVKAKLKELAKKDNKDFNALCLQYCIERFLHLISLSQYRQSLILK